MRLTAVGEVAKFPGLDALLERAPGLLPGVPLEDWQILERYDSHYYSRLRGESRPLPVLRLKFADATWFHLDVASGELLERSNATNRIYRWLYNGLHFWDFPGLLTRPLLREVLILGLSLGGLLLSLLGVAVGWRRLRGHRPGFVSRQSQSGKRQP